MRVLSSVPLAMGIIANAVLWGLAGFGAFAYISAELWAPLTSSVDSGPVAVPLLDLWHSTAAGWEQPVRSLSARWSEAIQKVNDLGIADQITIRLTIAMLLGAFASATSIYIFKKLGGTHSYWSITKDVAKFVGLIGAIGIAFLQGPLLDSVKRPTQLEELYWHCGAANHCGLKTH